MNSLLLLIEGEDELRPLVKDLNATPVHGAAGYFEVVLPNETRIILVTTGVGPEQAYQVTLTAIQHFNPGYVLSAGTCGALIDGLSIGDWVVTGNVRSIGKPSENWPTLRSLQSPDSESVQRFSQCLNDKLNWHQGRLVTVSNEPVHGLHAKLDIATRHEAIAVDMESFGIARAAMEQSLPWIVARVVVDTPAWPLPELGAMNVHTGRPPLSGIAKYVLLNPFVGPRILYSLWALVKVYACRLAEVLPDFTADSVSSERL